MQVVGMILHVMFPDFGVSFISFSGVQGEQVHVN